jgi:transposase-like protein
MPKKKEPDKIADLLNPIFTDVDAAREHLEALRWPDGPYCPHCGETENVTRMEGESHRPGLIQCNACRKNFSVTVGTLFERSHIPLNKWMLAFHLVAASKKAMSAHQMHRQLDVTYKTAWFMMHRIREAMATTNRPKLGGEGKIIEADETFWGQKPGGQPKKGYHHKNAVVALVERGGEVRAFHVPSATAQSVRKVLDENAEKSSHLMTDEAKHYRKIGREFDRHSAVNHTRGEYVRGDAFTNTIESFFAVFKRGLVGTYHHVGAQHLHRYVSEFEFRYNNRKRFDADGVEFPVTDAERAEAMLTGITGKRLTYRRIGL